MNHVDHVITAVTHQTYGAALAVTGRRRADRVDADRDRGAVSLEQVLWFVAAGISVAVIAGILWNQIANQAEQPITPPNAPVTGGG